MDLMTSGAYQLYRLLRGSGDAEFTFRRVEPKSEDRNPDEPRFNLAPGAGYFVYPIPHTTFNEVLKAIHGINDIVAINKANLILTVDPAALSEQQFHLLSREFIEFSHAK